MPAHPVSSVEKHSRGREPRQTCLISSCHCPSVRLRGGGEGALGIPGCAPCVPTLPPLFFPRSRSSGASPGPLLVSAPGPYKRKKRRRSQASTSGDAARSSWSSSTAPRRVGCWWTPRAPLLPVTRLWPQNPSRSESRAQATREWPFSGACYQFCNPSSVWLTSVSLWLQFLVIPAPHMLTLIHAHTRAHTLTHAHPA